MLYLGGMLCEGIAVLYNNIPIYYIPHRHRLCPPPRASQLWIRRYRGLQALKYTVMVQWLSCCLGIIGCCQCVVPGEGWYRGVREA